MLLQYLNLREDEAVLLKYTRPLSFEPEPAECHFNVWLKRNSDGGSTQHGWVLAQDKSHAFAEAIFHTVWKSPESKLVDVTPRFDEEKRLLFVPDHEHHIELSHHEGAPAINTYDNVRLQGHTVVTPLESIKVVLQSDFIHKHNLWPW